MNRTATGPRSQRLPTPGTQWISRDHGRRDVLRTGTIPGRSGFALQERNRFPETVAAATCCGPQPAPGRSGFTHQERNGFPETMAAGTCCGRGPSAVRFMGGR